MQFRLTVDLETLFYAYIEDFRIMEGRLYFLKIRILRAMSHVSERCSRKTTEEANRILLRRFRKSEVQTIVLSYFQ